MPNRVHVWFRSLIKLSTFYIDKTEHYDGNSNSPTALAFIHIVGTRPNIELVHLGSTIERFFILITNTSWIRTMAWTILKKHQMFYHIYIKKWCQFSLFDTRGRNKYAQTMPKWILGGKKNALITDSES